MKKSNKKISYSNKEEHKKLFSTQKELVFYTL